MCGIRTASISVRTDGTVRAFRRRRLDRLDHVYRAWRRVRDAVRDGAQHAAVHAAIPDHEQVGVAPSRAPASLFAAHWTSADWPPRRTAWADFWQAVSRTSLASKRSAI